MATWTTGNEASRAPCATSVVPLVKQTKVDSKSRSRNEHENNETEGTKTKTDEKQTTLNPKVDGGTIAESPSSPSDDHLDDDRRELERLIENFSAPPFADDDDENDDDFLPTSHGATSSGLLLQRRRRWPQPHAADEASEESYRKDARAFESFSARFKKRRDFSSTPLAPAAKALFCMVVDNRLLREEWTLKATPEPMFRLLVLLRVFLRDAAFQSEFVESEAAPTLVRLFQRAAESYLLHGDGPFVSELLLEFISVEQKLCAAPQRREALADNAHKPLILLLQSTDLGVLHCALHALTVMALSPRCRAAIGELNSIEMLLRIVQDYDNASKRLAANLLKTLCSDSQIREQVKVFDGVPIFLGVLHQDSVHLLREVIWCLVQMADDPDASSDMRQMGAIPLLLSMLHGRKFVLDSETASFTLRQKKITNKEEKRPLVLALQAAICTALSELMLNDSNAQAIVQANGIYTIGLLILPQRSAASEKESAAVLHLQKSALRALRFLFSLERNRKLFQYLFYPELYAKFIDIGHYVRDLQAYSEVIDVVNRLPAANVQDISEKIKATDQNKAPMMFLGQYAVFDLLGTGAFGSVFKVKKRSAGQSFLAMKEINTQAAVLGKNAREKEKSIGEIVSELSVIKEQLRHPNVVRYYRTFIEANKLYIVMELIEGASMHEHFNSAKEKNDRFSEDRVWNIFTQIVLALRYLHKEKRVIHRDLTPNNVMLGDNDHVTITDFGLAKVKQTDASCMTSVVGTILYSCPEIIKNEPYDEKVDVWAAGCILYEMCALRPAFYSANMLSLATKIVEGDFEPLPDGAYSAKVSDIIATCLTPDGARRPDVVEVGAAMSSVLLSQLDSLRATGISMERKLERERRRTHRHFDEANRNMQNYHRLFLASQESCDKLSCLSGTTRPTVRSPAGCRLSGSERFASDLRMETFDSRSVSFSSDNVVESATTSSSGVSSGEDVVSQDDFVSPRQWTLGDDSTPTTPREDYSSGSSGSLGTVEAASTLSSSSSTTTLHRPTSAVRQKSFSESQANASGVFVFSPRTLSSAASAASAALSASISKQRSRNAGRIPRTSEAEVGVPDSSERFAAARRLSFGGGSAASIDAPHPPLLRPNRSASSTTLAISPRKVRQISDPLMPMLNVVHKIIYICQLPPTLTPDGPRHVVERFKRRLFSPRTSYVDLKSELKKLVNGSKEQIDLNFGWESSTAAAARRTPTTPTTTPTLEEVTAEGVTYEDMMSLIDSVLSETGYYAIKGCN